MEYIDTGEYIWAVTNNGMDGHDWSRNNIRTGGAGAIGHRYSRAPERLGWLAEQENLSAKSREYEAKEVEEKARVKDLLMTMVARSGGWDGLEKMMTDKKMTTVCPREMVGANGKPLRSFSLIEVKRIIGS